MKVKLGEMISFWKYDEGGASGPVPTKFFEGTPNPYAMTFETYNKTNTVPRVDAFGKTVNYTFDGSKYDQFLKSKSIAECLTIKHK